MNIFWTDPDPITAAISLPDCHVVKMPVESVQMLVSACIRHGQQPAVTTAAGTIHRGGYAAHPCTIWTGGSRENALWLWQHAMALCLEFRHRYGHDHACRQQLRQVWPSLGLMPSIGLTPPALAMPVELQGTDPVESYRAWIRFKVGTAPQTFVWRRGRSAPHWI